MQDSKMWLLVAFSSNSGLSLGLRAVLARPEPWPVSLFCLQCAFGISEQTTRVSFNRTIRREFGVGMVGEKPNLLFPWSKPFYRPLIWCNGTFFPIPSPYLNRNIVNIRLHYTFIYPWAVQIWTSAMWHVSPCHCHSTHSVPRGVPIAGLFLSSPFCLRLSCSFLNTPHSWVGCCLSRREFPASAELPSSSCFPSYLWDM